MASVGKDLIIPAALGATGFGLAGIGPLAALSGSLGAGAGAAGAASGALGAQGAAGLLGSAGATAAGYGGATSALGGASALGAMAEPTQALMGDGVTMGNTIAADGMTANSYTGGYDALNGFERFGQRATGLLDGMTSSDKLNVATKGLNVFGREQDTSKPQHLSQNVQRPRAMTSPQSFVQSSNSDQQRQEYLRKLGLV